MKNRFNAGFVLLLCVLSCAGGCKKKLADGNGERVLPTISSGLRQNSEIQSLCFSPDGKSLVVAYKQTMNARYYCELWNVKDAKLLRDLGEGSRPVFSTDGKIIVMEDGALIETKSGKRIRKASLVGSKKSAALSPDGKLLALAPAGGFELRKLSDERLVRPAEKSKSFMSIVFHRMGNSLQREPTIMEKQSKCRMLPQARLYGRRVKATPTIWRSRPMVLSSQHK